MCNISPVRDPLKKNLSFHTPPEDACWTLRSPFCVAAASQPTSQSPDGPYCISSPTSDGLSSHRLHIPCPVFPVPVPSRFSYPLMPTAHVLLPLPGHWLQPSLLSLPWQFYSTSFQPTSLCPHKFRCVNLPLPDRISPECQYSCPPTSSTSLPDIPHTRIP